MRKRTCIGLLMMSLYFTLAATAGYAQSDMTLKAHVPFDFEVAGKTLPAGEYSVKQISESGSSLIIQSTDGRANVIVLSNEVEANAKPAADQARLVFHRYGDQYFFETAWRPGGTGRMILESRRERRLRKELRIAERDGFAPTEMHIVTIAAR